jgi:hypothetical protein
VNNVLPAKPRTGRYHAESHESAVRAVISDLRIKGPSRVALVHERVIPVDLGVVGQAERDAAGLVGVVAVSVIVIDHPARSGDVANGVVSVAADEPNADSRGAVSLHVQPVAAPHRVDANLARFAGPERSLEQGAAWLTLIRGVSDDEVHRAVGLTADGDVLAVVRPEHVRRLCQEAIKAASGVRQAAPACLEIRDGLLRVPLAHRGRPPVERVGNHLVRQCALEEADLGIPNVPLEFGQESAVERDAAEGEPADVSVMLLVVLELGHDDLGQTGE